MLFVNALFCFHSISFPNEWGEFYKEPKDLQRYIPKSFHSISFPNEWGDYSTVSCLLSALRVSIQLVSPTSGETHPMTLTAMTREERRAVFPFN